LLIILLSLRMFGSEWDKKAPSRKTRRGEN
jgi:hypothetical protein